MGAIEIAALVSAALVFAVGQLAKRDSLRAEREEKERARNAD